MNKLASTENFTAQNWVAIPTIGLGILVLIGWKFDISVLMTIIPDYVSMKVNTALFFILSGVILHSLTKAEIKNWQKILPALLFLFAYSSLLQNILDIDFGIDQLFTADTVALANGHFAPGRPSTITSLSFATLALVFMAVRANCITFRKIAQYGLHFVSFLSFIAILGFLFNVPTSYKLSFFTSMALHTSITLFALSISTTMFNPGLGITGIFAGERIGNLMARNIFKKIFPSIIVLGFLQLVLSRSNMVSVGFGIAMFTTCFTLIAIYALWSTQQLLNTIDDQRNIAKERLKKTNRNLERTVQKRTAYLSRQNKQLEDFSYIISHNLRGPLGNLKTLLDFYSEEDSIEGKDQLMEYFNNTVQNLSLTLEDLLEVVTIRHDSKKDKEKLVFEDIFQRLRENYQGKIIEYDALITSDFSKAPTIDYSSMYLTSIMGNLLSNALKYKSNSRRPEVHITTRKVGGKVELSVSDNGLGIDLERHGEKLFGLRKTFHKHPEAKGVGLFITKAQVEAMGGEISVQSEVDSGTNFKILL